MVSTTAASAPETARLCGSGSPHYLAPEWLFHGQRDLPADIFSFGVVMLYLLRRIPLTDQERGWNIFAARSQRPQAVALMKAWFGVIKHHLPT